MSLKRTPSRDISDLLAIMADLRDREHGCPWDIAQTFDTIVPYTIEEAYEVADAIARNDLHDLRDELGDLLLQVVFHARMAEEIRAFDFGAVVEAVTAKMIRRHPHVYEATDAAGPSRDAIRQTWADIKAQEKARRDAERRAQGRTASEASGILDGVPLALPALTRAFKLQEKASRVGFDWNDARLALAKVREECDEVEQELPVDGNQDASNHDASNQGVEEEIGDLLFAVANVARLAGVDPETALRRANAKFARRFAHIESALRDKGRGPEDADLSEMDALWNDAKRLEKTPD